MTESLNRSRDIISQIYCREPKMDLSINIQCRIRLLPMRYISVTTLTNSVTINFSLKKLILQVDILLGANKT